MDCWEAVTFSNHPVSEIGCRNYERGFLRLTMDSSASRHERNVSALLLAAGSGKRMVGAASGGNKVLIELGGNPLFVYSLRTLLSSGCLDRLVLVHRPQDENEVREAIEKEDCADRVLLEVGGAERFESVYHGLRCLASEPPEIVLIHDSARPFATEAMVRESIEKASAYGAATVAVPLSDTLKRGDDGFLVETLPRQNLYRIQTPQTFRFDLIWEAHRRFREHPDAGVTDDCMLLEKQGNRIALVLGHESNIKVTTPFDLSLAKTILSPPPV